MLVLTRLPETSIQIGPDIKITLLEIRGNKARIGIAAPPNVKILRTELLDGDDVAQTIWGPVEAAK